MLGKVVPAAVSFVERFDDAPDARPLPGEEAVIVRARAGRRGEFLTARDCARRALANFGVPPVAIPPDRTRGPRWPMGFVGSITHCRSYRAAAVGRSRDLLSIGIDAEPHRPLPPSVVTGVLLPDEQLWLRDQPPGIHYDTVVFSLKESVYKAWSPLTGRWLGFHDARVSIELSGTCTVRLLVPAPDCLRGGLTGRFHVADGLIVTAMTVTRDPAP
jgi:4'-phosphopantetheinyl transferase EntD